MYLQKSAYTCSVQPLSVEYIDTMDYRPRIAWH